MSKRSGVRLLLVLAISLSAVPAFAGSAVVGSVAGSLNTSVGGQAVLPHTVIFSGDTLQVKDGAAVLALDNGNRVALGRDTVAAFMRNNDAVTIVLTEGNVSLFHPDGKNAVKVQAGNVTVEPVPGFKTLGDVAMANGTVLVTAKDGSLRVNDNGRTIEVAKGKTIALTPKAARAPQAGGSQKLGGGSTTADWVAVGAGGTAAILAGIALSRAGDAKNNALSATSAANAATSAAAAADSDAVLATSAATMANATANSVGCALNDLGVATGTTGDNTSNPSPYIPVSPNTCPPVTATPF